MLVVGQHVWCHFSVVVTRKCSFGDGGMCWALFNGVGG